MTLLSTAPKHLGASEAAAPKGCLKPPNREGSKNKEHLLQSAACGTQGLLLTSTSCEGGSLWAGGPGAGEQPAHPCLSCLAHKVLSSLPLQVMLYFNVYYFPVWCLAEGIMLHLKVPSHGERGDGRRCSCQASLGLSRGQSGQRTEEPFQNYWSPKIP